MYRQHLTASKLPAEDERFKSLKNNEVIQVPLSAATAPHMRYVLAGESETHFGHISTASCSRANRCDPT